MSAIPADLRVASPWRLALPAVLALQLLVLVAYRDTALEMVGIWARSETFTHGFLVAPISAWLVWRDRARLAALTPRPAPWALLPLLLAAFAWLFAEAVFVNAAAQFALVAMLVLTVPTLLGWEVARALTFPLLFLFFSVPFGEFMLPTMMEWTADFAVAALQATGVPVYREGLQFVIPTGTWSVVEECSGVRYLIASFMVGTLFAHLNYRSWQRRAAFVAVSLVVPIFANWLRAYMIVMIGHLSGNKLAVGVDHLLYGWVFFGVVIALMFVVGARFADAPLDAAPAAPARARDVPTRPLLFTLLAAALAVQAAPLALQSGRQADAAAAAPVLLLPERLGERWQADDTPARWAPQAVNPSRQAARRYTNGAHSVIVHVAYYRGEQRDRKLVTSSNQLVSSQDKAWKVVAGGMQPVTVEGHGLNVRAAEFVGGSGAPLLAWQLYWVDGRYVASDAMAKLAQLSARLRGRGDDGAWLVLHAEATDAAAARAALERFAAEGLGPLDAALQRTRNER